MTPPPRLEMREIIKKFGSVTALDGVDLHVAPSEVHGLLGGNGAGKTTLMNVLYGLYKADSGTVSIDGVQVDISSPRDAIDVRVGMVHQTFLQVESYSVLDNIVLGTRQPGALRVDTAPARAEIVELSERFGLAVDPDAIIEDLPVGVRQRVEILKALYRRSKVLVFDEPTTNLTPQEVDDLFESLRAMVDDGMSVILITHKIRETMQVCDRMTVMREGRRVATYDRANTSPEELASAMIGESVDDTGDEESATVVATGVVEATDVATGGESVSDRAVAVEAARLTVRNDHGVRLIDGLDLTLDEGECVGIAGVSGNGQVELAEALAGVRVAEHGTVHVGGADLTGAPTARWLRSGVAYVPEDRHRDGILPTSSITENLLLGSQSSNKIKRYGLIDWRKARARAVETIERFSVRASGPSAQAGDLSGGNIQRVILARAFAHEPKLLILHNPTRGLDLHSTQFVYEQVRAAMDDGCAVLVLSEDLDEVVTLSDRVFALYAGRFTGEWPRGAVDPYVVGRAMTGLEHSDA
ncbi:ABC transporter ATP-binding protein [Nocardioidaceae bacterium SCSIO 66511]|nr:ABC transporter ATP-binding protein [Nocardioidaceae bacterium SCSIO 66511]